jgi:hypothetical protein
MLSLADFLVSEVRLLECGTELAKKEVKDQIPFDRVKDAAALARELRWRVRVAAGHSSDDEAGEVQMTNGYRGMKRKRSECREDLLRFKNFKPRQWDKVTEKDGMVEEKVIKSKRPDTLESWQSDDEGDGNARVSVRRNVLVKLRYRAGVLERERIERVVEEWTWM